MDFFWQDVQDCLWLFNYCNNTWAHAWERTIRLRPPERSRGNGPELTQDQTVPGSTQPYRSVPTEGGPGGEQSRNWLCGGKAALHTGCLDATWAKRTTFPARFSKYHWFTLLPASVWVDESVNLDKRVNGSNLKHTRMSIAESFIRGQNWFNNSYAWTVKCI